MGTMIEILTFLIKVFSSLYLSAIILRFLLQLARADFYNPISQLLVKLTNPILIPLRKVIPGFFGIDIASIIFAVLFHYIAMQTILFVIGAGIIPPLYLLGWSIIGIALHVIQLYLFFGFVLFITSFIAPYSRQPAVLLVNQLMNPLLRPVQQILPPMGGLDFSLFFVGILLVVIRIVVIKLGGGITTPFQYLIGYM